MTEPNEDRAEETGTPQPESQQEQEEQQAATTEPAETEPSEAERGMATLSTWVLMAADKEKDVVSRMLAALDDDEVKTPLLAAYRANSMRVTSLLLQVGRRRGASGPSSRLETLLRQMAKEADGQDAIAATAAAAAAPAEESTQAWQAVLFDFSSRSMHDKRTMREWVDSIVPGGEQPIPAGFCPFTGKTGGSGLFQRPEMEGWRSRASYLCNERRIRYMDTSTFADVRTQVNRDTGAISCSPGLNNARIALQGDKEGPGELKLNNRTGNILWQNVELDEHSLRLKVQDFFDVRYGRDMSETSATMQLVADLAYMKEFDPVRVYLDEQVQRFGGDESILDEFAYTVVGCSQDSVISGIMWAKFFVGVVKRVYCPGEKLDSALILHGVQSLGKSTLWELLSAPYFDRGTINPNSKDMLLRLRKSLLFEWDEMSGLSYHARESMRSFITQTVDIYRPPYARQTAEWPRRVGICGTTNKGTILSDPDGDRRYHVITSTRPIDFAKVVRHKDELWAAAAHRYLRLEGQKYNSWLTPKEVEMKAKHDVTYTAADSIREDIGDILEEYAQQGYTWVGIREIHDVLAVRDRSYRKVDGRIEDLLRSFGMAPEPNARRRGTRRMHPWSGGQLAQRLSELAEENNSPASGGQVIQLTPADEKGPHMPSAQRLFTGDIDIESFKKK